MVEEAISFWSEIQRFENMLIADPRSLSFAPLSELYRKLGLLDDAISVAKKGCDLHPDYPGGFFALGAACLDKGLKEDARPALERVVQLNPEHVRALKLLGQLYVEIGENLLAKKMLQQVLEQNPEDTESSLLLHSLTMVDEVALPEVALEEEAAEAEEIADDEEILEELEVIEELDEILEDEPLEPLELSEASAAEAAEPFGFSDDLAAFEPAAAPESSLNPPRDPHTTATLAELYVSQGFLDKGIAIYQELLATAPENQGYRLRHAELKVALERQQEEAAGAPAAVSEFASPAEETLEVDEELPAWEEVAAPVKSVGDLAGSAPAAAQEPAGLAGEFAPLDEEVATPSQPELAPQGAAPAAAEAVPAGAAEAELSRWLENIRRRKDGV